MQVINDPKFRLLKNLLTLNIEMQFWELEFSIQTLAKQRISEAQKILKSLLLSVYHPFDRMLQLI